MLDLGISPEIQLNIFETLAGWFKKKNKTKQIIMIQNLFVNQIIMMIQIIFEIKSMKIRIQN